MKRLFLLLVFTSCYFLSNAQIKTIYFNEEDQVISDSTEAVSYAILGRVSGDSVYTVKKFDADGYLTMTGSYKDDSLKVPHGSFVYYDWVELVSPLGNNILPANGKERYISVRGNFKNGMRDGRWITYYQNNSIKDVINYKNNLMNGEYRNFNYNGKLETLGNFVNNKREGTWSLNGGRVITQYQNDKAISTVRKSKKELEQEKATVKQ
jgi:hypothetical protein